MSEKVIGYGDIIECFYKGDDTTLTLCIEEETKEDELKPHGDVEIISSKTPLAQALLGQLATCESVTFRGPHGSVNVVQILKVESANSPEATE